MDKKPKKKKAYADRELTTYSEPRRWEKYPQAAARVLCQRGFPRVVHSVMLTGIDRRCGLK